MSNLSDLAGLAGEIDLAAWQQIQDQGLAIADCRAVGRSRFVDAPTGTVTIELGIRGDGHGHADLTGWMAVMGADNIGQLDYIDTQIAGFRSRFDDPAKTPTFIAVGAHPSSFNGRMAGFGNRFERFAFGWKIAVQIIS